jgi:hypothetical protein
MIEGFGSGSVPFSIDQGRINPKRILRFLKVGYYNKLPFIPFQLAVVGNGRSGLENNNLGT